MKKAVYVLLMILAVMLAGCGNRIGLDENSGVIENQSTGVETNQGENDGDTTSSTTSSAGSKEVINTANPVQEIMDSMTLEEKAGQVFMAAFRSNSQGQPMLILDESAREQIKKYHLGGVILFSQNIETIPQTKKLIEDMKASAQIPMFIAVDEEGGRISRLNSSGKMHATKLPGNLSLGRADDPELSYKAGVLLGQELSSLGFNMDFAPVADVNTNPKNPVIGDRSFGQNPEKVGVMVAEMVKGLQDQNVSSVLKHFPGHGDTSEDTHSGAVIVNHNIKRLREVEFIPFIKGIEAGADGVMAAHIEVPEVTGEGIPATFSKVILNDILRNELEHKGLIITDALEMGAISKYWSPGEAAVRAFEAGADILLIPASLEEAYKSLLDAVKSGRVSEERLDESVRRILDVKSKRGVLEGSESTLDPEAVLGSLEHLEIAAEIKGKASRP